MPFLSIIIPVFNREKFVARCIQSVLGQNWDDYDIIIVDDCSSDRSLDIINEFDDKRITLLRHQINQGVGPAMNTGLLKAQGEWVLRLDSDDELVSECLKTVHQRLSGLPTDVMGARFLCRLDNGNISPDPLPTEGLLDYQRYVKFLEDHINKDHDFVDCVRAKTYKDIRYPTNSGLEDLYHLDFHKKFSSWVFHDVVRLYHQDADNQLAKRVRAFNPETDMSFVRDRAAILEQVLEIHGPALRKYGPGLFHQFVSRLAVLHFLTGHRTDGLQRSLQSIAAKPLRVKSWIVPVLGLFGSRAFSWSQIAAKRFAENRTVKGG